MLLRAYQSDWGLPVTGDLTPEMQQRLAREHPDTESQWYQVDGQDCEVWNPLPQARERVTWTGGCANGRISGQGTLIFSYLLDGIDQIGSLDGRRSEGEYMDGKENGYVTSFNDEGVKIAEGDHVGGMAHGKRILYYSDGRKLFEGEFRRGERHGFSTQYSYELATDDGIHDVITSGNYSFGKRQGEFKLIYSDGEVRVVKYESGKVVREVSRDKIDPSKYFSNISSNAQTAATSGATGASTLSTASTASSSLGTGTVCGFGDESSVRKSYAESVRIQRAGGQRESMLTEDFDTSFARIRADAETQLRNNNMSPARFVEAAQEQIVVLRSTYQSSANVFETLTGDDLAEVSCIGGGNIASGALCAGSSAHIAAVQAAMYCDAIASTYGIDAPGGVGWTPKYVGDPLPPQSIPTSTPTKLPPCCIGSNGNPRKFGAKTDATSFCALDAAERATYPQCSSL